MKGWWVEAEELLPTGSCKMDDMLGLAHVVGWSMDFIRTQLFAKCTVKQETVNVSLAGPALQIYTCTLTVTDFIEGESARVGRQPVTGIGLRIQGP